MNAIIPFLASVSLIAAADKEVPLTMLDGSQSIPTIEEGFEQESGTVVLRCMEIQEEGKLYLQCLCQRPDGGYEVFVIPGGGE